jgi:hypothetical protein
MVSVSTLAVKAFINARRHASMVLEPAPLAAHRCAVAASRPPLPLMAKSTMSDMAKNERAPERRCVVPRS